MTVQQLSVFLENKSGRLAAAAAALAAAKVNIRALTIAETASYGVLRMIVNDPRAAETVLRDAGIMAKLNPVIAVEIPDREGVLHEIAALCDRENANVEYMYSFVEQTSNKAIMFLRFDDSQIDAAAGMFVKNGYKLLSPQEVSGI